MLASPATAPIQGGLKLEELRRVAEHARVVLIQAKQASDRAERTFAAAIMDMSDVRTHPTTVVELLTFDYSSLLDDYNEAHPSTALVMPLVMPLTPIDKTFKSTKMTKQQKVKRDLMKPPPLPASKKSRITPPVPHQLLGDSAAIGLLCEENFSVFDSLFA